jgi:hypothetical protein
MEFRVLDEVVEIEGAGLMLLAAQEDCALLYDGCRIRDARGNIHVVNSMKSHDGLVSLLIRDGQANYFQRLFRDVFVDATLFALQTAEGND